MQYRSGSSAVVAAAIAMTLVPAVSASGPIASATTSCGNSTRLVAYQIKATKVSCSTAKKTVIPQWNKKCAKHATQRCTLASGYTCKGRFDGYEGITVRCTKGTRVVRWLTT